MSAKINTRSGHHSQRKLNLGPTKINTPKFCAQAWTLTVSFYPGL